MTKLSVAFCFCLDVVKSPITGCQRNIFFRPKYMGWLNAGTSQRLCPQSGGFYFLSQHVVHDRVHVWSAQAVQHEPCCRHGLLPHLLPKTTLSRFLPGMKQKVGVKMKTRQFFLKRSYVVHNLVSPRKFLWPRHNCLLMEFIQLYLLQDLQMEVTRQANCSQRPYIPPSGTSLLSHRVEKCTIFLLTQDYDRG